MNVVELIPAARERVQFTLKHRRHVPHAPGCYALTVFDGLILYVGLTDNLHRRFGDHRDDKEKIGQTRHGKAFWFYYLPCELREINRVERTWQNQHVTLHGELPILNKISSPVR